VGGGTKTVTNNTPWAPAQPYILQGLQNDQSVLNANQPGLQSLASGLTSNVIPGIQNQIGQNQQQLQPGYNYINSTLGTNPGLANPANSQLSAYGNGNYLNSNNAQVQQLAQFAGQQAGNAVNSAFSQAGRTGSGANQTDLARGVTQAELQPLLQNNQYEQGLQQQALGMLGQNYNYGLGMQSNALSQLPGMTAAGYSGYTPLLAGTQLAGQLPYMGINSYANALGALSGNYGTSTSQQSGGLLNNMLGAGAMLGSAAIMASDRRLKTNLKLLGRAKDGLGVWEWNWKSDPNGERVTGVIADEVKTLRPHAYVENYRDGYDGVNYAALGSMA
jgi:hypothetical protein